ncbi:jun dimerization protein 2 isoform X4 [Cricetulus griseus]|uniref:Jun dimerization protein 2 isoform X4 n=1 Tax=Cricetulus griseus TaxID=10029 RepID=A0A9J7GY10_CRIGR|nr:jun dimerization protein 2 isoform X4 [Cricetulus griseus]
MMPGQIPDPSVTAGSLPGLGPLTGLPSSALTTEELKYADIRNIGAMIAPLHFLEVKLGKRPQPVKSEVRLLFSRQSPGFQMRKKSEGKGAGRRTKSPRPDAGTRRRSARSFCRGCFWSRCFVTAIEVDGVAEMDGDRP